MKKIEDHEQTVMVDFLALQEFRKELRSLAERGFGTRERIQRKLAEELGEYSEAVEYHLGSTDKKRKFGRQGVSPGEKLREEACDLVMMSLAAAQAEGLDVVDVCRIIADKLKRKRGASS